MTSRSTNSAGDPQLTQTDRTGGAIDWPEFAQRTPGSKRERTSKYRVTLAQAITDIKETLVDRLGVDGWRLSTAAPHRKKDGRPYADAAPDDPGAVVRWTDDEEQYAVACDHYTDLKSNVRTIGLYLEEKRKMADRPIKTGQSEFATARLPPGDTGGDDDVLTIDPYEVLQVSPKASDEVVEAAARRLSARHHPDSGEDPDRDMFVKVQKAETELLEG